MQWRSIKGRFLQNHTCPVFLILPTFIDLFFHCYYSISFTFKSPEERKNLRCLFSSSDSSWLRLGPMKIQVHWNNPSIFSIKELLSRHECTAITTGLSKELNRHEQPKNAAFQNTTEWEDVRVMKK